MHTSTPFSLLLAALSSVTCLVDEGPPIDMLGVHMMVNDIVEHYEEDLPILDVANMDPQEVAFHFFQNHDYDEDRNLDGLELYKALTHDHDHGFDHQVALGDDEPGAHKVEQDTDRIIDTIDSMLELHDLDNDGVFSYHEFMRQSYVARNVRQNYGMA